MLGTVALTLIVVSSIPLVLSLVIWSPGLIAATIIPSQILLGGMERGSVLPGLRAGELVLGVCAACLLASPRWRWQRLGNIRLNTWMGLYVATGFVVPLISWRLHGHALSGDVVQAYAATGKAGLLYLVFAGLELSDTEVEGVLKAAFWSVVLSGVVAILQVLHFAPVEALLLEYFKGPHLYERLSGEASRATGLAANWHSLGIEFVLALLIGSQLRRLCTGASARRTLAWGMGILVLALGTVRTLTSIVLFAGLLAVPVRNAMDRHGRRLVLWVSILLTVAAAVALAVIASASRRNAYFTTILPASLYVRLYYWLFLYGPIIRSHALLGYGPFLPIVSAKSDDSQFVLLLLRGGFLTLTGWLVTVGRIAFWSHRETTNVAGVRAALAQNVFASTVALVAASIMQSFFTYGGVVEFYWVLVAMLAARATRIPKEALVSATPPA